MTEQEKSLLREARMARGLVATRMVNMLEQLGDRPTAQYGEQLAQGTHIEVLRECAAVLQQRYDAEFPPWGTYSESSEDVAGIQILEYEVQVASMTSQLSRQRRRIEELESEWREMAHQAEESP